MRRLLLLCILLTGVAYPARAGEAAYTERPKIDFDTAMALLNPYGTWSHTDGRWTFTPLDHAAPYTDGRWVYTEYGWAWLGRAQHSWLTEHYGFWKRGPDRVWTWFPGPYWLPQAVEIRASPDGVGWRSAEVDREGHFVEEPSERFTKIDEWTFVTSAQFAGPIVPGIVARDQAAERLLEESTESQHDYLTYRLLERPGPHPADFVNLGDGGMFAPMSAQERRAALRPAPKVAPKTDVALPQFPGVGAQDPSGDRRQVKYWITMSLPTYWTPPPVDAKRNELYLYRPDFFQDQDGIERRISLWLDPSVRKSEAFRLSQVFKQTPAATALPSTGDAGVPATPAKPARDPFASPILEDSFGPPGGAAAHKTPSASSKSPLNSGGAPIDATNAPPAGTGA